MPSLFFCPSSSLPLFLLFFSSALILLFLHRYSIDSPSIVHRYSIETMDKRWRCDGDAMEMLPIFCLQRYCFFRKKKKNCARKLQINYWREIQIVFDEKDFSVVYFCKFNAFSVLLLDFDGFFRSFFLFWGLFLMEFC